MAQRAVILDESVAMDAKSPTLRKPNKRAEYAEAEFAKRKQRTASNTKASAPRQPAGMEELRKDSMMCHLLDSLEQGKDIGHYGRLVFAMVARHFLPHEQVVAYLCKEHDVSSDQVNVMLHQVEDRDYSPPRRERIVKWQHDQAFPILPKPEDPDCGNLYRHLKFPETIYSHIVEYQEQKLEAEA